MSTDPEDTKALSLDAVKAEIEDLEGYLRKRGIAHSGRAIDCELYCVLTCVEQPSNRRSMRPSKMLSMKRLGRLAPVGAKEPRAYPT